MKKNVIVMNETTDYSDYRYSVISCETGMPLEYISLSCCGQDIEAQYLIDRLKENNVYSADFCKNPQDVCCGKRPIDIKCGNWFGAVVAEMVLAGLKENRDYNILHTYGMKWEDGFYAFFKENDEDEE